MLKSFVKSALYDNIMILAVVINTFGLGMDRYGIPEK